MPLDFRAVAVQSASRATSHEKYVIDSNDPTPFPYDASSCFLAAYARHRKLQALAVVAYISFVFCETLVALSRHTIYDMTFYVRSKTE